MELETMRSQRQRRQQLLLEAVVGLLEELGGLQKGSLRCSK